MSGRGRSEAMVPAAGMRWKASDAQRALSAWESSGESMSGFARRHGLSPQRLLWWRERLKAKRSPERVSLAPLVLRSIGESAPGAVTIEVDGGIMVHVREVERAPASWVAALVSALGRGER